MLHAIGDHQGVAAAQLTDGHRHRGVALQVHGGDFVAVTAELHFAHIAKANQATVFGGFDHEVAELVFAGQASLQLDGESELLIIGGGSTAHLAGGHQAVLTAQGIHHIAGGELHGRQLAGIKPDADRQFTVAVVGNAANTGDPLDAVGEVLIEIAANRLDAVVDLAGVFVGEVVNKQRGGRCLIHHHTRLLHLRWQTGFSQ